MGSNRMIYAYPKHMLSPSIRHLAGAGKLVAVHGRILEHVRRVSGHKKRIIRGAEEWQRLGFVLHEVIREVAPELADHVEEVEFDYARFSRSLARQIEEQS